MKSRGRELNAGKLHARKEEGCRNLKMDEFSAGIQGPGGNAGEQSGERSEIEIFDFVNQKPDLTTMDKGLFIESGARNLPKRTQDPGEPGPRYENAWEEIELRDTERRAEEKRRAESVKKKRSGTRSTEGGNGKKHRSGARGTGAGDGKKRTAGNHGSETGRKHAAVKRAAESGKRRVAGKRRAQRIDRMRRERAVRIQGCKDPNRVDRGTCSYLRSGRDLLCAEKTRGYGDSRDCPERAGRFRINPGGIERQERSGFPDGGGLSMGMTAVVTGASGGFGYEFAKLLARDGYDLVLVARSGDKLKKIADSLSRRFGVTVCVFEKDLSEKDAAEEVFSFAAEKDRRRMPRRKCFHLPLRKIPLRRS